MPLRRIMLIRHCESTGSTPDASLTDRGHAQARELADRLAGCDVESIVSSPYLRARQSIGPFAVMAGLAVRTDPRLAERVLAPEPFDDWRAAVRRSFSDLEWKLPAGESMRAAQRRGRAAVDAVLGEAGGLAVLVTHGQLMSLVLRSIDSQFGFAQWERLSNPDAYLVEVERGGTLRVRRWWCC